VREARRDAFVRKYSLELIVGRIEKSIEKLGDKLEDELERAFDRIQAAKTNLLQI
jgi:hypothetical protein